MMCHRPLSPSSDRSAVDSPISCERLAAFNRQNTSLSWDSLADSSLDSAVTSYENVQSGLSSRRCRRTFSAASSQVSSCAGDSCSSNPATSTSSGYGSSDYLATAESEIDQLIYRENSSSTDRHLDVFHTNESESEPHLQRVASGVNEGRPDAECTSFRRPFPVTDDRDFRLSPRATTRPSAEILRRSHKKTQKESEYGFPVRKDEKEACEGCCCKHCPSQSKQQGEVIEEEVYDTIDNVMSETEMQEALQKCVPPPPPPRVESARSPSRTDSPCRSPTSGRIVPAENYLSSRQDISLYAEPDLVEKCNVPTQDSIYIDPRRMQSMREKNQARKRAIRTQSRQIAALAPEVPKKSLDVEKNYSVTDVLRSIERLGIGTLDEGIEEDVADCDICERLAAGEVREAGSCSCDCEDEAEEQKPPVPQRSHRQRRSLSSSSSSTTGVAENSLQTVPPALVHFLAESQGIFC